LLRPEVVNYTGAHIQTTKYTPQKINKLKEYLDRSKEMDKPIEYEIFVDGLKAVPRTSKPEAFDLHETFVDADTCNIEIIFYRGSSNHNDRHIFTFKEEAKHQSLDGLGDIETRIKDALTKAEKEHELKSLLKENDELKDQINDLIDEINNLEANVKVLEEKQSPLNGILGGFGANLVESLILKNPKLLSAIPGGQALAGFIEPAEKQSEPPVNEPEIEVSFKPTGEKATPPPVNEAEKALTMFVKQLLTVFTKAEFERIMVVLNAFNQNKALIEEVITSLEGKHIPEDVKVAP
jgi:hypothetical protein